jgi:hypothetical protein
MMKLKKSFLFMICLIVFVSILQAQETPDPLLDSVRTKVEKVNADADQVKPKADELQNLYAGYKARAKKCDVALKEAEDGYNMAKEAVKDLEEVKKLTAKALKAKKGSDGLKQAKIAEQKVHQAKYYIKESEERKKEVEFELKGCH